MMTKVRVWRDPDAEDPCSWGRWKLISFGRSHSNYVRPDELDLKSKEVQAEFKNGQAFVRSLAERKT